MGQKKWVHHTLVYLERVDRCERLLQMHQSFVVHQEEVRPTVAV